MENFMNQAIEPKTKSHRKKDSRKRKLNTYEKSHQNDEKCA